MLLEGGRALVEGRGSGEREGRDTGSCIHGNTY